MSRVLDSLSKLEKKDTRITFYSAPQYPDLESSNVHLSPLSTEQSCDVDSISITQGVFPFHSLHIQSLHSHSLPSSSGQENLAAFQSLQSIDPSAPLSSAPFLHPSQAFDFCSLTSTDVYDSYLGRCSAYSYSSPDYFQSEEVVDLPPSPCRISDDETDTDTSSLPRSSSSTLRRVSLILEDAMPRCLMGFVSRRGPFVASPRVDNSVATSGKGEGASSAASFGDSLKAAAGSLSLCSERLGESEGSGS